LIFLKDPEINTIYNHDFSDNERLNNARDPFIIGLRTGLRVSDFLRLKQTNIKEVCKEAKLTQYDNYGYYRSSNRSSIFKIYYNYSKRKCPKTSGLLAKITGREWF